jgi:formylglycine-generating enzyme required for sulfatase activity
MLRPDFSLDENVANEIERRIGGSLAMNRDMFQYLAYNMHGQGQKQGREIEEKDLRAILQKESTYNPYIDDLIAQTRQRNTLMEERGGMYRFIHLSFQEFLAGRYLAQNHDIDGIVSLLEDGLIQDSWWREPVSLLIGYLDIIAPVQAHRLLTRLARVDAGPHAKHLHPDTELSAVEIAATAFLECQNQAPDLRAQLQYRLHHLIQRKERVFSLPILRANAADVLDRLGYVSEDLQAFVPIPNAEEPFFYIAKYPVTNVQYARFLAADDFNNPELWKDFPRFDRNNHPINRLRDNEGWEWLQKNIDKNGKGYPRYWSDANLGNLRRNVPVVGVTWYEANAYCKWLLRQWRTNSLEYGKTLIPYDPSSLLLRLPLESEWVSAVGSDNPEDRFPWDQSREVTKDAHEILRRSNVKESEIGRTTPVWMYPLGVSLLGAWDMSGNTWEWQANYSSNVLKFLAIRGGSWSDLSNHARVSVRHYDSPYNAWNNLGFRILAIPC